MKTDEEENFCFFLGLHLLPIIAALWAWHHCILLPQHVHQVGLISAVGEGDNVSCKVQLEDTQTPTH